MKLFAIAVASAVGLSAIATTQSVTEVEPVGTITGTVTLEPPPPPRRASRARAYDGRSGLIQQLPSVVYVSGPLGGVAAAQNVVMTQRDTAFAPGVVAIPVGGTVSFPNEDSFFHNVFSYSEAKRLDLGRYPQGDSKDVLFDQVGVVELFCEAHDQMRGAVIVTENPFHSVVAEDGSFTIAGVPAGEHTVVFWSADHRPEERTVTVTDGGTSQIEVELKR
ncbi:MAG: carboxypeptidase regulatory-like domain-containing protein [Gemmatimonadota bacterium]